MRARLTYRPATVDDTAAIAEFQTATWNEAYAGVIDAELLAAITVSTRSALWGRRLTEGERDIRLVEEDHSILAVVSFGDRADERPGPRLELMSIYLASSERGTGLADELLALTIGERDAVVWVFEANARAIAFYQRHGFVPDGEMMPDRDTGMTEIRLTRNSHRPQDASRRVPSGDRSEPVA